MRYAGQGHEIRVPINNEVLSDEDAKKIKNSFEANYEKLYSRILPNADIEILTWSLSLSILSENSNEYIELASYEKIKENSLIDFCDYESGEKIKIPNYERTELNPGDLIQGQCVITEAQTTIVVSNNFNTKVLSNNFLLMEYTDNE
jgi:N-methylhydantoinase A